MFDVLLNTTFRRLLIAQIVALIGTGLTTVALGLLAYDLAGANAGAVLGTALFVKMIAYVGLSPFAGALASRLPRRALLVAMDFVRTAIVVLLPFVDQIWQIYLLIFLLQSASAIFSPTFQATIPDVVPGERNYTRALSLSRLTYDLESLASPALAAMLLLVIDFHWLFAGTAVGFLVSAALVLSVRLPRPDSGPSGRDFLDQTTLGLRIYAASSSLRGFLALCLAVAAAGSMVLVNSVVLVRDTLGRDEADLGAAMAIFGAGSMAAALALPRLLDRWDDRRVMMVSGASQVMFLGLFTCYFGLADRAGLWPVMLVTWFLLGLGFSGVLTTGARLLRRSADAADRPAVYAAHFALSHACWLVTYPLAGWLGAAAGMTVTLVVLCALTLFGVVVASRLWPAKPATGSR